MDWEGVVQQLIQNQQNFRQAFAQFLTHQANVTPAAAGAIPAKKIVASLEAYDGSPQKFHEWWSKVKVWIATTLATASDQQKAVVVYLRLEGPCAGCFAQVHFNECMAVNAWPTWATLQMEIEAFFPPRKQQGVGKVPTPVSSSGPLPVNQQLPGPIPGLEVAEQVPR